MLCLTSSCRQINFNRSQRGQRQNLFHIRSKRSLNNFLIIYTILMDAVNASDAQLRLWMPYNERTRRRLNVDKRI